MRRGQRKRQRQKEREMKMINDRQAKRPKESQKETVCVRQRKQRWRKAMQTESSLYSACLLPLPSPGKCFKVNTAVFTLGSLRLIGWHGTRHPKTSLLGAAASALWVAYAYEVRIQEKCWGLSSSFFQVSWGCRKSSVEQGRQELWLWFEFGTAWLGVLRFSTQALDQLIPEAF